MIPNVLTNLCAKFMARDDICPLAKPFLQCDVESCGLQKNRSKRQSFASNRPYRQGWYKQITSRLFVLPQLHKSQASWLRMA